LALESTIRRRGLSKRLIFKYAKLRLKVCSASPRTSTFNPRLSLIVNYHYGESLRRSGNTHPRASKKTP